MPVRRDPPARDLLDSRVDGVVEGRHGWRWVRTGFKSGIVSLVRQDGGAPACRSWSCFKFWISRTADGTGFWFGQSAWCPAFPGAPFRPPTTNTVPCDAASHHDAGTKTKTSWYGSLSWSSMRAAGLGRPQRFSSPMASSRPALLQLYYPFSQHHAPRNHLPAELDLSSKRTCYFSKCHTWRLEEHTSRLAQPLRRRHAAMPGLARPKRLLLAVLVTALIVLLLQKNGASSHPPQHLEEVLNSTLGVSRDPRTPLDTAKPSH